VQAAVVFLARVWCVLKVTSQGQCSFQQCVVGYLSACSSGLLALWLSSRSGGAVLCFAQVYRVWQSQWCSGAVPNYAMPMFTWFPGTVQFSAVHRRVPLILLQWSFGVVAVFTLAGGAVLRCSAQMFSVWQSQWCSGAVQ
jgi:hypothetical protein